ncbi:MAG: Gfo/Idh/MocA family oxidoreductase [Verrucomicrobiae bacterium]|nr:Gfo/Idh/MocA family oxidoreductase [Verrucomicrobiae bacterium]
MNRRDFVKIGAASAALATSAGINALGQESGEGKTRRVGLIGTGWYGKADLLRLIQVEPVEVVSLCDVDSKMLNEAADLVASRQKSGNRPKLYADYREMLAQKNLDIVLIATPDHWHALPMIAAVEAGADVYVQKPISLDIVEGQAMLAAARKHERVVQVGMQRRSTPHLIEARENVVKKGLLGKVAYVEICCYYHMRNNSNFPNEAPPENLDFDLWTGPAPLLPYNRIMHPRGWRAFNEYGNGIVGDMCVHMLDMVRWMLDLGMPKAVTSTGGILVQKDATANITDTQTAMFDYDDIKIVWTHRSWGDAPDPEYPWAAFLYGDKGTLKASVNKYDFIPRGGGEKVHKDVVMELEEYPEDKTEKDLERHVAPAIRGHMKDLLACIDSRGRPVADIEEGYISTTACILANLSLQLGGRTLKWDHAAGKIISDDEANALLARPYRGPWVHPTPESV